MPNRPPEENPIKVFESSKNGRLLAEDSRIGFKSRVSLAKPKPGEAATVVVGGEEVRIRGIRENVFEVLSPCGTREVDFSVRRVPINTMD